jgi:hypothetical protein
MDSRNTEATTAARDQSVMRIHVLSQWGSWPLGKIDHAAVQAWVTDLGKRRSADVVAKCYQLTSAVLRSAVRNRLIAFNPCEGIRLPRRRKQDNDERVIERHDVLTRLLPSAPIATGPSSLPQPGPGCAGAKPPDSALTHWISAPAPYG